MAESKHEASRNKLTKAQPKFNRTNINIDSNCPGCEAYRIFNCASKA